jgi:hypothetical protein
MGELLSAMNVFSLAFCFMLLVKGLTVPSTTDSGSSGNWIIDFYWCVADLNMHELFHIFHILQVRQGTLRKLRTCSLLVRIGHPG